LPSACPLTTTLDTQPFPGAKPQLLFDRLILPRGVVISAKSAAADVIPSVIITQLPALWSLARQNPLAQRPDAISQFDLGSVVARAPVFWMLQVPSSKVLIRGEKCLQRPLS
jgi:hypothetical protein